MHHMEHCQPPFSVMPLESFTDCITAAACHRYQSLLELQIVHELRFGPEKKKFVVWGVVRQSPGVLKHEVSEFENGGGRVPLLPPPSAPRCCDEPSQYRSQNTQPQILLHRRHSPEEKEPPPDATVPTFTHGPKKCCGAFGRSDIFGAADFPLWPFVFFVTWYDSPPPPRDPPSGYLYLWFAFVCVLIRSHPPEIPPGGDMVSGLAEASNVAAHIGETPA